MHISKLLVHSTIKLTAKLPKGTHLYGTGFFFEFRLNNKKEKVIVTNKHLIEEASDAVSGTFHFKIHENNMLDHTYHPNPFHVTNFTDMWIVHPNPNIDLAICRLKDFPMSIIKSSYYWCIPENVIPDRRQVLKFSYIEDVIMIGYPNNIQDKQNMFPIIRRGITATPIEYDFNGNPIFLIDISTYKGSSGSPIFILNENSNTTKNNLFLLGIIFETDFQCIKLYKQNTNKELIKEIEDTVAATPIELGYVIKSNQLLEFKTLLEIK